MLIKGSHLHGIRICVILQVCIHVARLSWAQHPSLFPETRLGSCTYTYTYMSYNAQIKSRAEALSIMALTVPLVPQQDPDIFFP